MLVGRVVAVPFPAADEVGALPVPVMIELEPITEDPTPVLVGSVVSVPFPAAVVVGALEISVEVGELPDPVVVVPKMLERMLPSPVESTLAGELTSGSAVLVGVGVDVPRTPVEAGPVIPLNGSVTLATMDESRSDESAVVVDAAAEESTEVLGSVIPAVELGRILARREEIMSEEAGAVVDAAAEESTPVLGPVIPAVDEGTIDESAVVVGARALVTPERRLLTPPRMPGSLEEAAAEEAAAEEAAAVEVAAVEAAAPEPEIPDVMLSDELSELAVELASALEDVKIPPGPNVIPLPVELAADDGVVPGSELVAETVGKTMIEGIDPVDATDDESRTLERNDSSESLVLSLELGVGVAAEGSAYVVSDTITVVTPSLLAAESLEEGVNSDPVEAAAPELDPNPSLVNPNRSDNDRFVDCEWDERKSWEVSFALDE